MRKTLLQLCLISLTAIGCGQDHSIHLKPNSLPSVQVMNPTSVTITRQKYDKLKALDATITDINSVRNLYLDLRSSGLFPSGTFNCPADLGIIYTLTFKSGNKVVLTANADPTGCHQIQLSTGQALWGTEPFWSDLAKSLGLPDESDLLSMQQ